MYFSFFSASIACCKTVAELKIPRINMSFAIDIFAYCSKIDHIKHCLHFCCSYLQSWLYVIYGFYDGGKAYNCIVTLCTAINFNQFSINCLAANFELA